jgi:hypothetical protein
MCEARFFESFVEGWGFRDGEGLWFLDFGTVCHKAIEIYYNTRHKPGFDIMKWALTDCKELWAEKNLDRYEEHEGYKNISGVLGFSAMMLQYAQYFHIDNERFRVIGTELYFGKNKEVPLLSDHTLYPYAPFRLYLSGKIDLLVDDGRSIGPMDHKTSKDFRGQNPAKNYEIQDGMTGYVYAAKSILQTYIKDDPKFNNDPQEMRQCNKIWMNFLQVKPAKTQEERFKRIPLFKSDWELEEYRLRQISTVAQIYQLLANPTMRLFYNTMACTNYMHQTCPFFSAHKQKDKDSQLLILNADFQQGKIWDPENIQD